MAGQRRPPDQGGEGEGGRGGGRLQPHPLVRKLLPEGGTGPADAVVLHGYPGDAPAPGRFLLWLSLDFVESVAGDDDDILHNETLPDDGGEIIWVRAGAKLEYRHTEAAEVEASFLGGPITSEYLGGAAAAAAAEPDALYPPPTFNVICPTRFPVQCTQAFLCRPSVPLFRCPRLTAVCAQMAIGTLPVVCHPGTTPLTGCPPPTTAAGCPPTTPLTGCPPPTTAAGCSPTTPLTGCPPTSPRICPPSLVPHLCGSTEPGSGRGCPTAVVLCPTAAVRCPRTDELPGCV